MKSLNHTGYYFSNGKLNSYGGDGYGTFDHKELIHFGDTVSVVETSCIGHCGNNGTIYYSKNVFNKKRQLIYTVFYPDNLQATDEDYEEEYTEEEVTEDEFTYEENGVIEYCRSWQSYEDEITRHVTSERIADTIHYRYNKKGLLLKTQEKTIQNAKEAKSLFTYSSEFPVAIFHQCYIGSIEMEKYLSDKLGYTPELILIEMYEQSVFSFVLNKTDNKYYQRRFVLLEQ